MKGSSFTPHRGFSLHGSRPSQATCRALDAFAHKPAALTIPGSTLAPKKGRTHSSSSTFLGADDSWPDDLGSTWQDGGHVWSYLAVGLRALRLNPALPTPSGSVQNKPVYGELNRLWHQALESPKLWEPEAITEIVIAAWWVLAMRIDVGIREVSEQELMSNINTLLVDPRMPKLDQRLLWRRWSEEMSRADDELWAGHQAETIDLMGFSDRPIRKLREERQGLGRVNPETLSADEFWQLKSKQRGVCDAPTWWLSRTWVQLKVVMPDIQDIDQALRDRVGAWGPRWVDAVWEQHLWAPDSAPFTLFEAHPGQLSDVAKWMSSVVHAIHSSSGDGVSDVREDPLLNLFPSPASLDARVEAAKLMERCIPGRSWGLLSDTETYRGLKDAPLWEKALALTSDEQLPWVWAMMWYQVSLGKAVGDYKLGAWSFSMKCSWEALSQWANPEVGSWGPHRTRYAQHLSRLCAHLANNTQNAMRSSDVLKSWWERCLGREVRHQSISEWAEQATHVVTRWEEFKLNQAWSKPEDRHGDDAKAVEAPRRRF